MKLPVVKYPKFRNNIQTGDILACMGESKMSKGIQWTEKKQDKNPMVFSGDNRKNIKGFFTHVGVFVRIGRHVFIVEANGKTVDFTRFSRTYKEYDGHLFIIRPQFGWDDNHQYIPVHELAFVERCLDVEGAKYDWKAIWTQLTNCFTKEIKKHKENKQIFCSELLNMASDYYWESKDEWCTPHDIARLERNNFLVRITNVK